MADPEWLRLVAADLEAYAAALESCVDVELEPGVDALKLALDGGATPRLQDDYLQAIRDVRAAIGLIRAGEQWARAEADSIDAAAEAAADAQAADADLASPASTAEPVLAF